MKNLLQFVFILFTVLSATNLFSQNVMINVLTKNSGEVKKGEVIFFEITINNTSPIASIPPYKIRPQISFPTTLVDVPKTGHILPKGWAITSNNNGVIILTNGTDVIPENENRTILIAIKGKETGGPSSIMGNLTFSNGMAPGAVVGTSLAGDNIADNASTSTVRVVK